MFFRRNAVSVDISNEDISNIEDLVLIQRLIFNVLIRFLPSRADITVLLTMAVFDLPTL